jgi:two-component system, NarL family, response regulator DevR
VIRICAADDHTVVLDGIAAMAERTDDIVLCGSTPDLGAVRQLVSDTRPDVLLLDLRFGGHDSLHVCRCLREQHPTLRIIIFSGYGDVGLLRAALRMGANGYALKDASTRDLPNAIRMCVDRGSFYDPQLVEQALLGETRFAADPDGRTPLNNREQRVVELVVDGKTNPEIATALNYSVHTIKLDVARLLRRFGLRRRVDLALYAVTTDLLTPRHVDRAIRIDGRSARSD